MRKSHLITVGIVLGVVLILATWFDMIKLNSFRGELDWLNNKLIAIKSKTLKPTNASVFQNDEQNREDKNLSIGFDYYEFVNNANNTLFMDNSCCDDIIIRDAVIYTD